MEIVKKLPIKSIAFAAVIASFVGLSIHIFWIRELSPTINNTLNGVTVLKPPYPLYINLFAYLTAVFPGLGVATLYYFMTPYFTTNSKFLRGILLGLLTLLIGGELIRQPLKNILVGNPVSIAFIQQSQTWLVNIAMGIIVAFLMPRTQK